MGYSYDLCKEEILGLPFSSPAVSLVDFMTSLLVGVQGLPVGVQGPVSSLVFACLEESRSCRVSRGNRALSILSSKVEQVAPLKYFPRLPNTESEEVNLDPKKHTIQTPNLRRYLED